MVPRNNPFRPKIGEMDCFFSHWGQTLSQKGQILLRKDRFFLQNDTVLMKNERGEE